MEYEPNPLHVETDPDGTILLSGELDMATVKELENAVAEVMRLGRRVVIDMGQLTFIDSKGLALLARTYQQTGERVIIYSPSRQVRRVLELMDEGARPLAWVIQD